MKKMKLEVMILGVAIAVAAYAQEAPADENNPPNAVVKLDVSTAKPDIFCPWANRTGASSGTGVVIAPGRILKGRTKENLWDISSPRKSSSIFWRMSRTGKSMDSQTPFYKKNHQIHNPWRKSSVTRNSNDIECYLHTKGFLK